MNCIKCGNPLTEGEKFCPSCGNPVENTGESVAQTEVVQNTEIPRISKRNIAGAVIFTILTCGLFMYFWFFRIINDTKKLTDDKTITTTPFKILLILAIVYVVSFLVMTIGSLPMEIMAVFTFVISIYCFALYIYILYLSYRIGFILKEAGDKYGKSVQNNGLLYLVLCFLGIPIVTLCVIQNDLNVFGVEKGQ